MTTASKSRTNGKHEVANEKSASPTFSLDRMSIRVVGISPLLCHNPAGSMKKPDGGTTRGASKIPESEAEAKAGVYIDDDGDFGFPSSALYSTIVTAAELMKLKVGSGRMAPSVSGMLIGGLSADFQKTLVKLVHPKTGKPLDKYSVDSRRCVIPSSGAGIVRSRPRFDEWSAVFDLLVDSGDPNLSLVLSEHLDTLLSFAGMRVGIGDYRPYVRKAKGKPAFGGPFGRFEAKVIN